MSISRAFRQIKPFFWFFQAESKCSASVLPPVPLIPFSVSGRRHSHSRPLLFLIDHILVFTADPFVDFIPLGSFAHFSANPTFDTPSTVRVPLLQKPSNQTDYCQPPGAFLLGIQPLGHHCPFPTPYTPQLLARYIVLSSIPPPLFPPFLPYLPLNFSTPKTVRPLILNRYLVNLYVILTST